MKGYIMLFMMLCVHQAIKAQDFSVDAKSIESELVKVYETSSNDAGLKHLLAKEWVAKTFGDYKSVLQFEDNEAHKIIIKGYSVLSDDSKLSYTIMVDSKDDRYRIAISDIIIRDYVMRASSALNLDEADTRVLRNLGADKPTYIDIEYSTYVSVDEQIADNQKIIKAGEIQKELLTIRIKELEEKGIDYSLKPRGMTKTLFRQRYNRGEIEGSPKHLRESLESIERNLEQYHANNQTLSQRIPDVRNCFVNILKSLYLTLDRTEDF